VRVEREGDRLLVTLDRPDRHNAFSAAMRDGLLAALDVALADPSLRVELTGEGPSFCSGGDLDEFGTAADPATAHLVRTQASAARAMAALAARTTVRLHGACMGAGIELPAFAAHVTCAPDALLALPELPLGLLPGAGGTVSLPRRIGRQRTALLALSGQPIDAATALEWGLVDELTP
jgi:enoyl-CoA hydratase/carnithine racemase